MLQLVHAPLAQPRSDLPRVLVRAERMKLAKRRWRGTAEDGVEFGFELETPLKHGQAFWETSASVYVIEQEPENVLEVSLDLPASAAAGIGWAVGNLHLELMSEPHRLLTPDDKAARQLLERIGILYTPVAARFHPGRFSRQSGPKAPVLDELGTSHRH